MNKEQSLADKISSILSTAPASFDPDDNNEETSAKVTEGALDDVEDVLLSDFRRKNVEILEEVDTKYAGKKGSRSNLIDFGDEWETNEESGTEDELHGESRNEELESEGDEDEVNEQTSKEETENEEDASGTEDGASGTDEGASGTEEDSSGTEEDLSGTEDVSSTEEGVSGVEEDENFRHVRDENVPSQMKKGLCVRNQLNIWENLLEIRIQMQKCLIASNKMPQKDYYETILKESDAEFKNKVNETKNTLSSTLNKLLELQTLVWSKYPETKTLLKVPKDRKGTKEKETESEEEIPSDTDVEDSEPDGEEIEEKQMKPPKKRMKFSDFENHLDERHKKYKEYRNSVIQKWNDKTRIGSSKSNLQHSVLNQIDHILTDRTRLIKRTQTKRSNYEIIGYKETEEEKEECKLPVEYNVEIFDDDDFYHQLLRELIEVKSADVTDPVQLGRQWIQLQNLRSKMKRKIDTRATKGRKIRYAVHGKLINFMAPVNEGTYTEEAKTELFTSLCGKTQYVHKL